MNFGSLEYGSGAVPADYRCSTCGANGVKLWRESHVFANDVTLECADCALKSEGKTGPVDAKGRLDWYCQGQLMGRTDQIGGRVPAIPTKEGDTYWGYTSVPQAGVNWWRRLPTRK